MSLSRIEMATLKRLAEERITITQASIILKLNARDITNLLRRHRNALGISDERFQEIMTQGSKRERV